MVLKYLAMFGAVAVFSLTINCGIIDVGGGGGGGSGGHRTPSTPSPPVMKQPSERFLETWAGRRVLVNRGRNQSFCFYFLEQGNCHISVLDLEAQPLGTAPAAQCVVNVAASTVSFGSQFSMTCDTNCQGRLDGFMPIIMHTDIPLEGDELEIVDFADESFQAIVLRDSEINICPLDYIVSSNQ